MHGIDRGAKMVPAPASSRPKAMTNDKRHSARQRKRFRVTVDRTSSFTLDVGAGGFATEMMRVLPPGTPVIGQIRLSDVDVVYVGEVAWSKPGDARMNLRGRMGVRFSRIRPDFATLLDTGDARPR